MTFGEPLIGSELESADTVAAAIDRHVIENYHQHATNLIAYQMLHGDHPQLAAMKARLEYTDEQYAAAQRVFEARMQNIPAEYRSTAIAGYANPVVSQLELLGATE